MYHNKPEVKIIADSIYPGCPRITTFELKYWRPLLPEMNTHRVFSRNAASSRAQSFVQKSNEIKDNPFVPTHWNQEKPGMSGGSELSEEEKTFINNSIQKLAKKTYDHLVRMNALVQEKFNKKIHKQYLNRYLEPFSSVTQLITSCDWSNFLRLRLGSDAQPEMQDIAWEIQQALETNAPDEEPLHLPYVMPSERKKYSTATCCAMSVARCARVSYKAYKEEGDLEKDIYLFERLKKSGHWSPFEHVAQADPQKKMKSGWRNFSYWTQYRAWYDNPMLTNIYQNWYMYE